MLRMPILLQHDASLVPRCNGQVCAYIQWICAAIVVRQRYTTEA